MMKLILLGLSIVVCVLGCATTAPSPEATESPSFFSLTININQLGYPEQGEKRATLIESSRDPVPWQIYDLTQEQYVLEGKTEVYGLEQASQKPLHIIDFSALKTPGRYVIKANGSSSYGFLISNDLYDDLHEDAFAYFYFHRMGEPLKAQYLQNPEHARAAIHSRDESTACYQDWCGKGVRLNAKGSWADAGDYGIYTVNHAISAWTMLNAYEYNPAIHADGDYAIPENKNGIPDLLDEVRVGSQYIAGLLPPNNQLASHKVTNEQWTAYPLSIAAENAYPRYAQPPSTAASYGVARVTAHLARTFKTYDTAYAKRQWQVAQEAWQRTVTNPVVLYTSQTPDSNGGGDYPDTNIVDDRYAALAELYITATVLGDKNSANDYRRLLVESPDYLAFNRDGSMSWEQTHGTGTLSLLLNWEKLDLPPTDKQRLHANVLLAAQKHLEAQSRSGFPTVYNPLKGPWEWGSNSFVVNNMIVLAYAYRITSDERYLQGMYRAWDYLLGNNALNLSYITGYGSNAEPDTLDGFAWTKFLEGITYPKGWLSGGPMNDPSTCAGEPSTDITLPPAIAYAPRGTGSRAWCSKENTINWNAPLYWLALFTKYHGLKGR